MDNTWTCCAVMLDLMESADSQLWKYVKLWVITLAILHKASACEPTFHIRGCLQMYENNE